MQLLVINLASQRDRWNKVSEEFTRLGLPASRVEGVLGAGLTRDELAELYSPRLNRRQYHKALVPGEIGCYASHIRVWQRLLASGETMCAVFEDDVTPGGELPEVLQAIESLPGPWDMIKLVGREVERKVKAWPLPTGQELISYRRAPSLTAAYVVSRRGAEKLLRRRLPFGRPIDVDLRYWWECDLRLFGVQPYPARLADRSEISAIAGRQPRKHLARRLHRLLLQVDYSWRNWRATLRPGAGEPTQASPSQDP
jgi:glycosyl transferase family 25